MQIKSFHTNQFAGIKNKDIHFKDGINVLYGNNETGKSTVLSAIYHTLFTSSKLDKRSDRAFIDSCFPVESNFIDATVEFDSSKVTKTWGKSTILSTDTGIYKDRQAEQLLSSIIGVKSIYDNLVFETKRNNDAILEWFFDFLKRSNTDEIKQELKALSAVEGISEEKFLALINEKICAYEENWNPQAPRRKRGIGIILQAYYDFCDAQALYQNALDTQQQIQTLENEIQILKTKKANFEKEREEWFSKYAEAKKQKEQKHNAELIKQELQHIEKALQLDNYLKDLDIAKLLFKEKEESENLKKLKDYQENVQLINTYKDEIKRNEISISKYPDIEFDIKKITTLNEQINNQKNKLEGINLVADIHADDLSVEEETGYCKIISKNGYVIVRPKNIDSYSIHEEIENTQKELEKIKEKYDNCFEIHENVLAAKKENEEKKQIMYSLLETLTDIPVLSGITVRPNLDTEIMQLVNKYQKSSLESLIDFLKDRTEEWKNTYGTINQLKDKQQELQEKLSEIHLTSISEEECEKEISKIKNCINSVSSSLIQLIEHISILKEQDYDIDELKNSLEKAEQHFKKEEQTCKSLKRIRKDFETIRSGTNPIEGFCNTFNQYLRMITNDQTYFDECIVTKDHKIMNPELFSTGTKQTIILAFKLALLSSLFKKDACIVIDDGMSDMDEDRINTSIQLLKEFAKHNQVIYATCNSDIAKKLDGNLISM